MSDDIVTRLREIYANADEVSAVFITKEAADEIEHIRNRYNDIVMQLRIQADLVNGEHYHTISGGLHLDAADEIERLRRTIQLMHIDFKTQIAGLNMRCRCKGETE